MTLKIKSRVQSHLGLPLSRYVFFGTRNLAGLAGVEQQNELT